MFVMDSGSSRLSNCKQTRIASLSAYCFHSSHESEGKILDMTCLRARTQFHNHPLERSDKSQTRKLGIRHFESQNPSVLDNDISCLSAKYIPLRMASLQVDVAQNPFPWSVALLASHQNVQIDWLAGTLQYNGKTSVEDIEAALASKLKGKEVSYVIILQSD